MIGYLLEQELGNLLPFEVPLATILTMVEVDPDDPAFDDPTKFVGPVYDEADGRCARRREGLDGQAGRRPLAPRRALAASRSGSSRSGRCAGCSSRASVVICAGGGGIPTMYAPRRGPPPRRRRGRHRQGPRQRACLSRELEADLFVMATDVDGVYARLGHARRSAGSTASTPEELRGDGVPRRARWAPRSPRPPNSSDATGKRAAIGSLDQIEDWSQGPPARTSFAAT